MTSGEMLEGLRINGKNVMRWEASKAWLSITWKIRCKWVSYVHGMISGVMSSLNTFENTTGTLTHEQEGEEQAEIPVP